MGQDYGWDYDDQITGYDKYNDPHVVTIYMQSTHPIYDPEQVHNYTNQTKVWINAAREEIRIKNMDKRYLFNVVAWMQENEDKINLALNFDCTLRAAMGGTIPYSWVRISDRPLYKKIVKRYAKLATLPVKG
jgi:hypothetical protein